MEMPSLMLPPHLEEMIYELQLLDIVPVLAHPERQMQLMEQPQKLLDLLHRGCVAQSNGGSLTGVFGPKVHNNVHRLLKRNMIAFMGSDAHNLRHRNTDLKGAREKLEQHWGAEAATELLETRPLHILQNKALPPELYADRLPRTFADEGGEKPKKKSFFAKLFG
jgi:protein-tyrosine phosphatase